MSTHPGTRPVAYLSGTDRQPEVRLYFDRDAVHAATGEPLAGWVKKAPRRRWNPALGCWVITAFGGKIVEGRRSSGVRTVSPKNPDRLLARAGFKVNLTDGGPDTTGLDPSLEGVLALEDLFDPLVRQSKAKPAVALARPRFAGYEIAREILGDAAVWDKEAQRFEVPLTDLLRHGDPKDGLVIDPATLEAARALLKKKPTFGHDVHDDDTLIADASRLALSDGLNLTDAESDGVQRLIEVVGDVPDWFGMTPRPYQRLGAIAVAAGRSLLCDPTGLGKTVQAIGALAIKDVDRAVIIVPPVTVTHWGREIEKCGLAVTPPKPPTKAELRRQEKEARERGKRAAADRPMKAVEGSQLLGRGSDDPLAPPSTADLGRPSSVSIVANEPAAREKATRFLAVFRAGRKEPDLPERGIVVVPDSLLTSRPALQDKIAAWAPQGLVYDEAHRARNWKSSRAKAVRGLVERLPADALRIPMTATPMFSAPHELASLLAISGHLDPVFGGYSAFVEAYCKRNHFNALVANKAALPELRARLREHVWVRRNKSEVLKDLPPKSRNALYVDVDLSGFRAAHAEVAEKIAAWVEEHVEEFGDYPEDETIATYARSQIGLMSPLRKAAGLAKVPVALDMVSDWINDEVEVNIDGSFTCDRPVVFWAHHHEVVDAVVEHAAAHLKDSDRKMVGVISGSTSSTERGRLVDEFQAGRLPVLVCSITAAGVGITLTRASDAFFIETDYTPALVSQAEDRLHRISQENPVSITTLLAEGTLDARIQKILRRKAGDITAAIDGQDADVSVMSDDEVDAAAAPAQIIEDLVCDVIEKHKAAAKKRRTPKAA
ncbi:DEAD/DEAH box helicase [Nocardioides pakistanensis]